MPAPFHKIQQQVNLLHQAILNVGNQSRDIQQLNQQISTKIKQFFNSKPKGIIQDQQPIDLTGEQFNQILETGNEADQSQIRQQTLINLMQKFKECKSLNIQQLLEQSSQENNLVDSTLITSYWYTVIVQLTANKPLISKFEGAVADITLSPDGKYIATSTFHEEIKIWDSVTKNQIGGSMSHPKEIKCKNYSKNGNLIVSGSRDKMIRQWNVSTSKQVGQTMIGHDEPVKQVDYSPIISTSDDKTIRIWNRLTGKEYIDKRIKKPDGQFSLSPIQGQMAFGNQQDIIIWDYENNQQSGETIKGHTKPVKCLQYSVDGMQLLSGVGQNNHNLEYVNEITDWILQWAQRIGKHSAIFSRLEILLSTGDEQTVRLWDRVTGSQIGDTLTYQNIEIRETLFTLDGRYIITACNDHSVRIILVPK